MTIPLIVFVGVLVLILGAYGLFVTRPEQQEQRKLKRRLKGTSQARQIRSALVKEAERLSSLGPLEAALARVGNVISPVQLLIEQSGLKLSVGTFVLSIGCAVAGGFLIGTVLIGRADVGVLLGAGLGFIPVAWVKRAKSKRLWKFEEQFPEAIDLISRALRAGHTFQSGLAMVADELQAPVGPEFRLLYDRQNFGMPITEALRSFAERTPVLDAKFFATAVLTQRDAGGNLAEVLDNLSTVIRDRFKVKRQVRVISAHGRITGWVLAGLPPVLSMLFMLISPKHMQTLFNDPIGHYLIATAIVLQVLGTLAIRKIVDIEY
jgi:tight adherence protein B